MRVTSVTFPMWGQFAPGGDGTGWVLPAVPCLLSHHLTGTLDGKGPAQARGARPQQGQVSRRRTRNPWLALSAPRLQPGLKTLSPALEQIGSMSTIIRTAASIRVQSRPDVRRRENERQDRLTAEILPLSSGAPKRSSPQLGSVSVRSSQLPSRLRYLRVSSAVPLRDLPHPVLHCASHHLCTAAMRSRAATSAYGRPAGRWAPHRHQQKSLGIGDQTTAPQRSQGSFWTLSRRGRIFPCKKCLHSRKTYIRLDEWMQ